MSDCFYFDLEIDPLRCSAPAAPSRVDKKMNRKEADAFFGKLEEGLKENFTIPKRKLSSSPDKSAKANRREASDSEQSTVAAEAKSEDVTSPEKNEDEDANALAFPKNTSPSKSSAASGYDRKPPGNIQTIIFGENFQVKTLTEKPLQCKP